MANKVIGDYSAASTIDGANHYLLIQPGNSSTAYNKINRNVFLGINSQPLGLTDTQSPTNKTFDNTNTATLKDTLFTLQDDGDTTKQARFQLSAITTGTTRTYTLPNASSTIADIATVQTFTNKTLTSPTITGGTIDNSTITVDSISGHTTPTVVTVGGVQMNNGTIGTSNAVVTASIADSAVTPAKLQTGTGTGWTWQSFTPTLTNLAIGNGSLNCKYIQIGKTVFGRIDIVFGTTTALTGSVSFTLPVTSISFPGTASTQPIGTIQFFNASTSLIQGWVSWLSTTTSQFLVEAASTNYVTQVVLSSIVPYTWANNMEIHANFSYEAA